MESRTNRSGMLHPFRPALLCLPLVFSVATGTTPVLAQSNPATTERARSGAVIEQIIVRARQREETLQEAPIAVTAITGEVIDRMALTDLNAMADYIPNLQVDYGSSGTASTMHLRGVGTGSGSAGFSSAVGLLIDGVYHDRGRWINQGFFDLEQLEVLKGPQALYFGKNNSAGLVILNTRNPGEEFEANIRMGNEFRADQRLIEGGVSIPLSETLGVRLAGRYTEQDGWITNTSLPQTGVDPLGFDLPGAGNDRKLPETEESLARLTLRWTPTAELEALFKASYARNKDNGNLGREMLIQCRGPGGAAQPVFGVPSPSEECEKNFRRSRGLPSPELFAPEPEEFGRGDYFTDFEAWTTSLSLKYDFDSFTIESVTAYQQYEAEQTENATYSDDAQVPFYESSEYDAWSQEFRIATNWEGNINILGGLHYSTYDYDFRNSSRVAPLPPDSRNGRLWTWDKPAREDSTSWSAYAELTWDITPEVELATGVRYTREKKDSEIAPTFVHEFLLGPLSDAAIAARFKDKNWSPQATLSWRADERLTLFVAYREGFKSGGFDMSFLLGAGKGPDDLTFESEEASGFEIGAKALLLDRTLAASLIAYRYDFDNLQVQQLDTETITFNIGNAAKARTTGVELEFEWLTTEQFSVRGALAYNRARYGEFFASCFAGQSIEAGCASAFDPAAQRFRTQDLAGTDLRFAPRWVAHGGVSYNLPVGRSGYVAAFTADGRYSDDYGTSVDRIPDTEQSSYFAIDGSITLHSPSERWTVAMVGRNLTNKTIAGPGQARPITGGASGVPAAQNQPLPDSIVRLQRGRQLWLQATWNF